MDGNGKKVQSLRQQFEVLSCYNDSRIPKSKSTSNFGEIMGRHGEADEDFRNMMICSGSNNNNNYYVPPKYHVQIQDSALRPVQPGGIGSIKGEDCVNRRNGIYVSNSITLHSSGSDSDGIKEELDEDDDDGDDEHLNDDDDGTITLGENDEENESQAEKNNNTSENDNDSGSQNGVALQGKVKRSNAFRKKDVVDSVDTRFVKTKLSLERVKSLDTSIPSNGGNYQKKSVDNEVSRTSSVCVRGSLGGGINHVHQHHHHNHQQQQQYQPQQQQQQQQQHKAVNIVAPYHISDASIYPHLRKSGFMSPDYQQQQHVIQHQKQPSSLEILDYATPIPVPRKERSSPYQHQHPHNHILPSKQYNINDEIIASHPPPIPPAPLSMYSLQHEQQQRHQQQHSLPQTTPSSTDRPLSVDNNNQQQKNQHLITNKLQENEGKSNSNNSIVSRNPPEKPPRTFLYDILSDQAIYQHQQRPLVTSNKAIITKSQRLRSGFYPAQPSVIKACESQQLQLFNSESTKNKQRINEVNSSKNCSNSSNNIINSNIPATQKSKINVKSNRSGGGGNPNHQVLTRSKTESQIVVKSKNRSAWENNNPRPSATGYELERSYVYNNNMANNNEMTSFVPTSTDYMEYNQHIHRNPRMNFSTGNQLPQTMSSSSIPTTQYNSSVADKNVVSGSGKNVGGGLGLATKNSLSHYSDYSDGRVANRGLMTHSVINNNTGKSLNVNRCRSDDRLCEKSKSEWSLHQVVDGNSVASGRRNTVANSSNNIHHTGHPSLESNSSSNNSSKLFRSSIQQSIQNLVQQLFSASAINGKDVATSTDSGIQLGSESLSSCDTPIGDSTTDTGDSDIENEVETSNNARQIVESRRNYIRQVSSFRRPCIDEIRPTQNRVFQPRPQSDGLFECLLVVGLNRDAYNGQYHPYIKEMYPQNAKLAAGVEQFCFPDSISWPNHEGRSAQYYTLAITDAKGGRKYGCCIRILPEGANICIPITYCLITSNRAIGFYREILKEITLRHGHSDFQRRYCLETLYNSQFPSPDGEICIQEPVHEETYIKNAKSVTPYGNANFVPPKTVTIRRKADARLDDGDIYCLLTKIDVATVIKIFGSMLHERKVVLVSRALHTLSLSMEALISIIFPFDWQHTFIPILPVNMPDILDAPSPFLIGVLKSTQTAWDKNFDDGIVVDLDTNKVLSCVGDESSILPSKLRKKLRDSLQCVLNLADQGESTKNVLFSECFIRMFVDAMGHFGNHIVQQNGVKTFEREAFIKASETKATQNFLDWFTESSMFNFFIESRLKSTVKHGLWEQRILGESHFKNSRLGGKNKKGLNWFANLI